MIPGNIRRVAERVLRPTSGALGRLPSLHARRGGGGTRSGDDDTATWERWLPWLVGFAGALLFLRCVLPHPASLIPNRTFPWDTISNIDILMALHRTFGTLPHGSSFYDWFYGGGMFFPQPRPLVTGELMPLVALVTWPFARWPVLANNAASALALILDCVAGASMARAAGAKGVSSTAAGIAFAFWAYTCFVVSRVQLLCMFPSAFALAATLRWARSGCGKDAGMVALWAGVQPLLCLYYAMFLAFVLPVVAVVARVAILRRGAVRDFLPLGSALVVAAVLNGALLWPYATLKSELGLFRPYQEQIDQSGDMQMFLWADSNQLEGRWLVDRGNWDTAYAPGLLVLLVCVCATVVWVWRGGLWRGVLLLMVCASCGAAAAHRFPVTLVLWTAGLTLAVLLARQGRLAPTTAALLALIAVALFLFIGPQPHIDKWSLGSSPYRILYDHLAPFSGMRMIRRVAFLFQLALAVVAAVALSRVERRRYGRPLVAAAALVMFVEGMPLTLTATAVANECTDPALRRLRDRGVSIVADIPLLPLLPDQLGQRHHMAALCGIATSAGYAGFQTSLSSIVLDAEASLPDPAAHAWLWRAGFRHAIARGRSSANQLRPITQAVEWIGDEAILDLKPPVTPVFTPQSHMDGPRLQVLSSTVEPLGENAAGLDDGDETTRWTSRKSMSGNESISLRIADAVVAGIEWHARGHATDLPRALRVEREDAEGHWVIWRDLPALSPLSLGRQAGAASFAIPLPPERASHIRLRQTGRSGKYWLSASEIEVVGVNETR
jgi:hypothetical protein